MESERVVLGATRVLLAIRWTMASYAATGNTDGFDRHSTSMVKSLDTADAKSRSENQRGNRILRV
jgi:hypothetical protein